jgi:hypothetical protein
MNTYSRNGFQKSKALRKLWRLSSIIAAGALVFLPCEPTFGAEHSPDGAIGKPGLHISGYRTDITFDGTDPIARDGAEFSSGSAGILFPISRKISLFASYRAENRLNILHQARVGARLRIFQSDNAASSPGNINPDGPLGEPYFSISGGFRTYENESDTRFGVAALEIVYPWKRHLTVSVGGELNTDTSVTIVDKFFGSLHIYTTSYLVNEPYANPDGPVGFLNFRISGGGSGEGFFGQLDILFPLNDQVTIGGFVRGERVAFPYERNAALGVRFQVYPGVVR